MKEFIFTYYREIIYCLIFLIELTFAIISICKKRKKETPILFDLLELVPKYIDAAEKIIGSGKGSQKRDFVLQQLSTIFFKYTGHNIDESSFKFLSNAIEMILSTPQKKEVK